MLRALLDAGAKVDALCGLHETVSQQPRGKFGLTERTPSYNSFFFLHFRLYYSLFMAPLVLREIELSVFYWNTERMQTFEVYKIESLWMSST